MLMFKLIKRPSFWARRKSTFRCLNCTEIIMVRSWVIQIGFLAIAYIKDANTYTDKAI
ncbi:hypothetical protein FACS18949_11950 [Clostridia bacterium]|nr:hypothetical protein FACS18949_11950 [Clostridia bacterium]